MTPSERIATDNEIAELERCHAKHPKYPFIEYEEFHRISRTLLPAILARLRLAERQLEKLPMTKDGVRIVPQTKVTLFTQDDLSNLEAGLSETVGEVLMYSSGQWDFTSYQRNQCWPMNAVYSIREAALAAAKDAGKA